MKHKKAKIAERRKEYKLRKKGRELSAGADLFNCALPPLLDSVLATRVRLSHQPARPHL